MKENYASYSIVKVGNTILAITSNKLLCASEDNSGVNMSSSLQYRFVKLQYGFVSTPF